MQPTGTASLLEALNWRYATRQFDPAKQIPADVWDAIEETLRLSASSYGLQPWRFLVVDNPAIHATLVGHSWGQRQVADASRFVVRAEKQTNTGADIDKLVAATASARGVSPASLDGYKRVLIRDLVMEPRGALIPEWAARQVYLAIGALLTSAALPGVDACPMEGLDPAKYDEVLGLAWGDYLTVAACAFGYRADSDTYATLPKVRYPRGEIIQHIS